MRASVCILTWLVLFVPCQASVIYVDVNTPDDNDGSSWTKAYKYLQDALADANSSGDVNEILVAQGTYKPDQNSTEPSGSGDREATFLLVNGVALRGGYAGFGEAEPNARDVAAYETILSGDLFGNDVDVNDPCDLFAEPTRAENSYHVIMAKAVDSNTVLEGFTITAGRANGFSDLSGGGMYNVSGSPMLANCIFSGNFAMVGGGIENYSGNSILTNCRLSRNWASLTGGGMDNYNGSPEMTNCTFAGNAARDIGGGGITNNSGNLTLTNCILWDNMAYREDAFGYVFGGGGILNIESGNLTLTNCILWDNMSYSDGNEIALFYLSTVDVRYCDVNGGVADIYDDGSGTVNWGSGNIDVDPCFADANNGDFHLQSHAGRWDSNSKSWVKDNVTSLCIDAGNPACTLLDEPDDANNIRINMGAYGGTAEASKSPAAWSLLADMNNDGLVDYNDLVIFSYYWLEPGNCIQITGDLNRNQFVDSFDFALFANDWLARTVWY
ncbi:MAG: hypothetical protein ACYSWP_01120 [Planctomycetota bacterium]|jgi:hypothetical protein